MKTYRRRNFFIKKDLQGRFIFRYFLLSFSGVAIFAVIFSFLSYDHLTITYHGQRLMVGQTPLVLLREMVTANWLFLVTVGVFTALVSMLLTHRVAGPLFRFDRHFEALAERNLDQTIFLRAKDEAKDTAELVNQATTALSNDLLGILEETRQIEDCLECMQEDNASSDVLKKAQDANRRVLDLLGDYRLKAR